MPAAAADVITGRLLRTERSSEWFHGRCFVLKECSTSLMKLSWSWSVLQRRLVLDQQRLGRLFTTFISRLMCIYLRSVYVCKPV